MIFMFPAEFKECFSLYDKRHKGRIDARDLITVMRCLGTSPTFNEIERHLQVHKIGKAHRRTGSGKLYQGDSSSKSQNKSDSRLKVLK